MSGLPVAVQGTVGAELHAFQANQAGRGYWQTTSLLERSFPGTSLAIFAGMCPSDASVATARPVDVSSDVAIHFHKIRYGQRHPCDRLSSGHQPHCVVGSQITLLIAAFAIVETVAYS